MQDNEILEKAIKKAQKNGWKNDDLIMNHDSVVSKGYDIIFDHGFAKAFWGDKEISYNEDEIYPEWQIELREMVLEKEPLKYLEKFL